MPDEVFIFVVEDDVLIQLSLKSSLEDSGFGVAVASTGKQAIEMLDGFGVQYRALVTDVDLGLSKLNGWAIAKRAREINNDLPVIYMTGKSAHEWGANGVPNSVLLQKPFATAQLVTAISQLLNLGNTLGKQSASSAIALHSSSS